MEKIDYAELRREMWQRMVLAATTLTQPQIDACAWVMGGSGVGWTRDKIVAEFRAQVFDNQFDNE